MLPLIISVSFALMLPVATPTNAIIFSHGHIKIKDMVYNIFNFDQIQKSSTNYFFYFLDVYWHFYKNSRYHNSFLRGQYMAWFNI